MTTHLSTLLVWHDRGWDGHICDHPSKNASCIAVRHIREAPRDDDRENDSAGQLLSTLKIAVPTFEMRGGSVVVTFTAQIGPKGDLVPDWDQVGTKLGLSRDQVLRPLLDAGLIEMTIPEKPQSSKQQYRTTNLGLKYIENETNQ